MFDFFFKRNTKKPASPDAPVTRQASQPKAVADPASDAGRQDALQLAGQLTDEATAVAFILRCEFADARLKAAAQVHSAAGLEQIHKALRNTDRRVAKLMQSRLEAVRQSDLRDSKARQCIEEALRLGQADTCPLSEVVALDRSWQAIGEAALPSRPQFDAARAVIANRLASQSTLQRSVIDTIAAWRQLDNTAAAEWQAEDASQHPQRQAQPPQSQQLQALAQQLAEYCAAPERSSLPKPLLDELLQIAQQSQQKSAALAQQHAALAARQDQLAAWESADPSSLQRDALLETWRTFPAAGRHPDLQTRFESLLQHVAAACTVELAPGQAPQAALDQAVADAPQHAAASESPPVATVEPVAGPIVEPLPAAAPGPQPRLQTATPAAQQAFVDALDVMERALEEGSLLSAAEQDKLLRAPELKSVRPNPKQAARLNNARRELARLQDWARWGGNVSREELIEAVESLPAKAMPVTELAKSVDSFRAGWRALDATSGSAPRTLWERFDAACNLAYAPAAEHFKKLSEERQQNLLKMQAAVVEVEQFASQAGVGSPADADADSNRASAPDWRKIAQFCQRMTQAWQRVGPVDRKDKKQLDARFHAAMSVMLEPLSQIRQQELVRREQLIAQAEQINAQAPQAIDKVRALQQRWQDQSRSMPLDRQQEQLLWQRFRSACDAIFAQRKGWAEAADDQRRQHAEVKQALCQQLEDAASDAQAAEPALQALLRESSAAWDKSGELPKASADQIEARYRKAVAAMQARLSVFKDATKAAQSKLLLEKVALCQAVEKAVSSQQPLDAQWQSRWSALAPLQGKLERALQARFKNANDALQSGDAVYGRLLEGNRLQLQQLLLEAEILCGLDSPAELAADRLRMQIGVLQSALGSGPRTVARDDHLLALCSLPVLTADNDNVRLQRLVDKLGAAS